MRRGKPWVVVVLGAVGLVLYVQFMPLVLVPLLQWKNKAFTKERLYFAAAIGLYVLAKAAELMDPQIFQDIAFLSGHTIKHLLSVAAGLTITLNYAYRKKASGG